MVTCRGSKGPRKIALRRREDKDMHRQEPQPMITISDLKRKCGLSDKWIKRLGDPDKVCVNPRYKCAAPMKLWGADRVDGFLKEHAEELASYNEKRQKRRKTAKQVAGEQRRKTIRAASKLEIKLDKFPKRPERAVRDSYSRHIGNFLASPGPRHILNMLRHEYSNYERLILLMERRVGADAARELIRDRVNEKIKEKLIAMGKGDLIPAVPEIPDFEITEEMWKQIREVERREAESLC